MRLIFILALFVMFGCVSNQKSVETETIKEILPDSQVKVISENIDTKDDEISTTSVVLKTGEDRAIYDCVIKSLKTGNSLKRARFSIAVYDKSVLLAGGVESPEMADIATRKVWGCSGVGEVNNQLIIDRKANLKEEKAFDDFLYNEINEKLQEIKDVDTESYKVVVYKKKVYVFGGAVNTRELNKVLSAVRRTRGISNIINYVKVEK